METAPTAHLPILFVKFHSEQHIVEAAMSKSQDILTSETELLNRINHGVSVTTRLRFRELKSKLNDEVITLHEHREYLAITDQIEQADAERIYALIELAQLRQGSVDSLMKELEIVQPQPA